MLFAFFFCLISQAQVFEKLMFLLPVTQQGTTVRTTKGGDCMLQRKRGGLHLFKDSVSVFL